MQAREMYYVQQCKVINTGLSEVQGDYVQSINIHFYINTIYIYIYSISMFIPWSRLKRVSVKK